MKPSKPLAVAILASIALTIFLCACSAASQSNTPQTPDYADDEAMGIIAKGLEARWKAIDDGEAGDDAEGLRKLINIEYDIEKPLRDRQFQNSKMQEDVIAFINMNDDSLAQLNDYKYMSLEYLQSAQELIDKRAALLKTFVDEYGLSVGKQYQERLDEIVAVGNAAQKKAASEKAIKDLVEGIDWEKQDTGYGFVKYSAVVENTTGTSYKNVSLMLALYDEENVRADETYAQISNWEKGEKARFETTSNIDAARIKTTLSSFEPSE